MKPASLSLALLTVLALGCGSGSGGDAAPVTGNASNTPPPATLNKQNKVTGAEANFNGPGAAGADSRAGSKMGGGQ